METFKMTTITGSKSNVNGSLLAEKEDYTAMNFNVNYRQSLVRNCVVFFLPNLE